MEFNKRKRNPMKIHGKFTKVVVEVRIINDGLECWIFKKGLREDSVFHR